MRTNLSAASQKTLQSIGRLWAHQAQSKHIVKEEGSLLNRLPNQTKDYQEDTKTKGLSGGPAIRYAIGERQIGITRKGERGKRERERERERHTYIYSCIPHRNEGMTEKKEG